MSYPPPQQQGYYGPPPPQGQYPPPQPVRISFPFDTAVHTPLKKISWLTFVMVDVLPTSSAAASRREKG
ncbi:hypothetical protein T440DRAFT_465902 [Plenodomus tracheiphilus IPT5]|uniref:Uncharacterized protein n=1 Tax=Plenodomus tracheiphilus IPT5 TaxID=1408161 RepID=A0A6A7BHD2_9PLEO|nr:hypothetical protein T440DRAFT_465902 [Plenodomus tracheiphilus IPT5]